MPTQNIHVIAEVFKNLEEASEAFAVLQKQLRYLQEHIDVENIISKSLTAEVIAANAITANEIAANSVTASKIQAGAVTAEKITVGQLSAISANLGHITAGLIEAVQIFGSYIATRNGTFPRAEMSEIDNLFAVYNSANNHVKFSPNLASNAPEIVTTESGVRRGTVAYDGATALYGIFSDVGAAIRAVGHVRINPIGGVALVDSFSKYAAGTPSSYQTLDSAFAANMAFDPGTRNLKLFAKNGTLLAQVNIP